MELGFFPCSLNMNNKNAVDKMLENSQSKTVGIYVEYENISGLERPLLRGGDWSPIT
jgi:hypothetical protein